MRPRGFGVLFALTLVIAAGTLYQDFRFDTLIARERDAALSLDRQIASTEIALADLRAAEAGYVATGQGPAFWMTRATDLFQQIENGLSALKASTAETDAAADYDAALVALADLRSVDTRARADITGDRRYEASDRVFSDTRESNERLAAELLAARTTQQSTAAANLTRVSRLRLGMNAVALVFVLAVAMFFWRSRSSTAAAEDAVATQDRPLQLSTPTVTRTTAAPVSTAAAVAVAPSAPAPPPALPARGLNLRDAAELCVDLARVIDGRDVPALLERAAGVLDAKGVILWMSDAAGALLRPQLAHGYSDRVLTKMGALQIDSDNATSLAFRSLRSQTVNGAPSSASGAIAVPLIAASGCVGVLAAEVNRQRPSQETVDVARIIAAQLAMLVAPGAEAARAAEG